MKKILKNFGRGAALGTVYVGIILCVGCFAVWPMLGTLVEWCGFHAHQYWIYIAIAITSAVMTGAFYAWMMED